MDVERSIVPITAAEFYRNRDEAVQGTNAGVLDKLNVVYKSVQ